MRSQILLESKAIHAGDIPGLLDTGRQLLPVSPLHLKLEPGRGPEAHLVLPLI